MLKPEYFVPVLITLAVTGVAGYFLYKKYQPTIGVLDTSNSLIGYTEKAFVGAEDFIANIWGGPGGNSYAGTSVLLN